MKGLTMRKLCRAPWRRKGFAIIDRPYCLWTCRDGSQVLADRRYNPIAERASPRGIGHVVDDWRWVSDIVREEWLEAPPFGYQDRAACRRWSDKILRLFLDGGDMRPVLSGKVKIRVPGDDTCRWPAPSDWPPPWPKGLRTVAPKDVPLSPFDRIELRLERERKQYRLRNGLPEPTHH